MRRGLAAKRQAVKFAVAEELRLKLAHRTRMNISAAY